MLVALAGLAGAGKTTAIRYLEHCGFGDMYYVGAVLKDAIGAQGLELTPENERTVRARLRSEQGMDVFARLALPAIRERASRHTILLDAIYCSEERDLYAENFGADLIVVAVTASYPTRAARLSNRLARPMSSSQLQERDLFELETLQLARVIERANQSIANEGSLEEFQKALDRLIDRMVP